MVHILHGQIFVLETSSVRSNVVLSLNKKELCVSQFTRLYESLWRMNWPLSSLEVLLERKLRESFHNLQQKEVNNADKRKF